MSQLLDDDESNVMWLEANFKVSFYQPENLEAGMWFLNSLYPRTEREFVELWLLEEDVDRQIVGVLQVANGPVDYRSALGLAPNGGVQVVSAEVVTLGGAHQINDGDIVEH